MHHTRRRFLSLTATAAAGAALARPLQASPAAQVTGGPAFGSYWRLTTAGPAAPQAHGAIAAVIAEMDARMSPYLPGSELSRLNGTDSEDWIPVSPETATVLSAAREMAAATGGAFDPTMGPLTARYGFGPIAGRAGGGFTAIETRGDAIRKRRAGVTLDLCGIAKGRALDRMAAALDALGAGPFLLELGGEVLARGRHPEGRAWRVAVEPLPGAPVLVLAPGPRAVATSGDWPQGYAVGGRAYSHIIDPRRAAPVTGALASVTVLAGTAMTADGLATALMALGAEEGVRLAQARGIDAIFLLRDGEGARPVLTGRAADSLLG